jgi:hypothetical protein
MLVISLIVEVNPHGILNLATMILDGLDLHGMNRFIFLIGGAVGYRDLMGNPVQPRTSFVEKFMFINLINSNPAVKISTILHARKTYPSDGGIAWENEMRR